MTLSFPGWFSLALLATLLLAGLSIALLGSGSSGKNAGFTRGTRFFLVALRLAIGWHFCVEGLDKLQSSSWSSEAYLRESIGPLAPAFRGLAGDRLADKLTVTNDSFPPDLNVEWQVYLDALQSYYALNSEERERIAANVEQAKKNAATWLTIRKKIVEIPSSTPPPLKAAKTVPERLQIQRDMEKEIREIEEDKLPRYGPEYFERWKSAKANLARWRQALARDLALITKDMKRGLNTYLLEIFEEKLTPEEHKKLADARASVTKDSAKERAGPEDWDEEDRLKDKWEDKVVAAYRGVVDAQRQHDARVDEKWDRQTALIVANVIDKKSMRSDPRDPLPYAVGRPATAWSMLDWSDVIVKYGITAVGVCLLLGLFTRTACVAGAMYLLLFFLAIPPLPGWPDSPRAEGHYLFINKNIIELLALLALATTRSGRWAGLDGLLQFFRRAAWRPEEAPATVEKT
ncbi:MAG: DoxX family protein [Planctomycetes bacterium]|nr:DoxX family protein [Planctomycetota bacterium]